MSDINKNNLIYRLMPTYMHPYISLIRLDRPIGFLLLFYPASFALAATNIPFIDLMNYLFLFLLGSIIMRSAGCIANDFFDIKFDKQVARTQDRALASSKISILRAFVIFLILMSMGLIVLIQFNSQSIIIGFLITPLVVLYPLAKRFFIFPQLILGLIYNWGIFIAWTSTGSNYPFKSILILYFSTVLWTIVYDTIYATQDEKDDRNLNLYSSTMIIKKQRPILLAIIGFIQFSLLIVFGFIMKLNILFFIIISSISLRYIYDIIYIWSDNSSKSGDFFKRNNYYGFLILLSIIIGNQLYV